MKKVIQLLAVLSIVFLAYYFNITEYLSLSFIKSQQANFQNYYSENPYLCLFIFFIIYTITTAASIPGAAVLTLLAGALFGVWTGTLLVSFASTLGATLAFLVTRYFLRASVEGRFKEAFKTINAGVEKDGAFYLFSLRLIPAVPFFVINLVFGLTQMRTVVFYLVSQLGMIPGTLVYVNAGTELAKIDSLSGLLSPRLFLAFTALALFPYVIKFIVNLFKTRAIYKKYKRPKKFDYNVVAIGGGAAGLVTSYITAATRGKVALIEKDKMGGDCLNTGCVPSKAIIRSAKFANDLRQAEKYGFKAIEPTVNFKQVMARVKNVIKKIEPHDSVERYTGLGVECFKGEAEIISPFEVKINGKTLTTRNIVIATGAAPFTPDIPGLDSVPYYTSDTIWDIEELPKTLVVLGGGPIGTELVQSFQRLGSKVIQIERGRRILSGEDPDVSELIYKKLTSEGVDIRLEHAAVKFYTKDNQSFIECELKSGEKVSLAFDAVLLAVGRKARTEGFGLEKMGIALDSRKRLQVNEYLQTNIPNIYGCGDVIGPYQFTHTAAHEAWYCAVNAMIKPFYGYKVNYDVIPWCTYSDPEVARVGLSEEEAKKQNIEYVKSNYTMDDLDRAITETATEGFVKVLTPPNSDKILGVTIVGARAGDIIAEFVTAMKYGIGLNKILGTIHIYPTFSEANKYAAGVWKKGSVTESTLKWGNWWNSIRRDWF